MKRNGRLKCLRRIDCAASAARLDEQARAIYKASYNLGQTWMGDGGHELTKVL
jgi:hypothetical protein